MSDNFFEHSTAAVGTIITIVLLGILVTVLIWG
jgi:membrane protein involved in colicin uptake